MKIFLFTLIALVSFSCNAAAPPATPTSAPSGGFCGSATQGPCEADGDCTPGGCAGQICQSRKEEAKISTCEYRECYNAAKFNLKCGCVAEKCQWH